jgi:hypothetical protein
MENKLGLKKIERIVGPSRGGAPLKKWKSKGSIYKWEFEQGWDNTSMY